MEWMEPRGEPGPFSPVGAPPRNRMAIALLSLVGAFLAFYLLAANLGWTPPVPCGTGDCATVQSSEYATVGPVPVSGIGLAGYVALLALSLAGLQDRLSRSRLIPFLLFGGALFGVLFSGYLTYLEAAVIKAWCRYCVASAIIITIVFAATLPELKRIRGGGGP
ncbi:MAG: vitamin K epoxide reductase family protein [Gemmatimonadetes bacterium]|nr:vitamin K epoxide reductase family protein [Gemmatimonadota bacterium]MYH52505.1 vitamin K epoxide reductase family protein [Gemmatimonadota bacterium]MYK65407.1 vitamin K epoxide reductase family protein [Gemmatimonadota bacterium]